MVGVPFYPVEPRVHLCPADSLSKPTQQLITATSLEQLPTSDPIVHVDSLYRRPDPE